MIDDVTRQFYARESRLLSPILYDALDTALVETTKQIRHPRHLHPHLHALSIRAGLRAALEGTSLPEGWEIGGSSRRTEQIYLHHPDSASSLRVLSESTVNPDGTPHAGHTRARQAQWSMPLMSDGQLLADRALLLLLDTNEVDPSIRIVHPTAPGKFKGKVPCDFEVRLLRDVGAMPERFVSSDEYTDLFDVNIEDFGDHE